MANDPRDTPAMRQYARFKQLHPGCVLLFRIGDFYEMFDEDAVNVSKAIGLTLTQRTAGVPMAGMPYHQLEVYLRKLIAAGFRVAVADQVQEAEQAKGLIDRAVTRVLTPGTLVDESLLDESQPNTLGAVCYPDIEGVAPGTVAAVALAELSTGAFSVLLAPAGQIDSELARRGVTELLYPETADRVPPPRLATLLRALGTAGTPQPQWHFRPVEARQALTDLFGVSTLAGFGFADDDPLLLPAGAIVRYLQATQAPDASVQRSALAHLRPPRREEPSDHLLIDAVSMRALEIDRTLRGPAGSGGVLGGSGSLGGGAEGSVLGIFTTATGRSLCRTAMGKRLLRDWLVRPLARPEPIRARQRCIATLIEDRRMASEVSASLAGVQDVQRIGARVALARCTPRDLVALGRSLVQAAALGAMLDNAPAFAETRRTLLELAERLDPLAQRIGATCNDEPPAHLREGGLVRPGIDAELDEARMLKDNAAQWLAEYQARLIAEHNLPSLKVGYNKVFGYFIELPKAQAARAPAEFSRRQTLTGAERYITPQLKEFEDKTTTAHDRAVAREVAIFSDLCAAAAAQLDPIARFGQAAAELDVLGCLAEKAIARRWVCPTISGGSALHITQGRHPVLDEILQNDFVPNDLCLGAEAPTAGGAEPGAGACLALITGPNMAGKSTFIRQTALLVLLAHTGSYIPAQSATIGLTDRIFTRIGADDALHAGQSTFMVEMTETANILHHATARSLVVLDEIGRGTSTLDGLSLAWAIAEALATAAKPARTLFATHYHELTQLEETLAGRVINLQVAVREWGEQIVFLHRIVRGRADQSYGIHVAKLAGIPAGVVSRARVLLDSLSVQHGPQTDGAGEGRRAGAAGGRKPARDQQLSLFTEFVAHPAVGALREIKIDSLTPLQAFDELRRLRDMADQ